MFIGFSRPRKFKPLAATIMWWMGTNYSHVFFCMEPEGLDRSIVIHANHKGVNIDSLSNFCEKNKLVHIIKVRDEEQANNAMRFAIDHLGKPYGFLSMIAIFLGIKFGDGKKTMICSELVARAFKLGEGFDYNKITPEDILHSLQNGDSNA